MTYFGPMWPSSGVISLVQKLLHCYAIFPFVWISSHMALSHVRYSYQLLCLCVLWLCCLVAILVVLHIDRQKQLNKPNIRVSTHIQGISCLCIKILPCILVTDTDICLVFSVYFLINLLTGFNDSIHVFLYGVYKAVSKSSWIISVVRQQLATQGCARSYSDFQS
jgi:hypothetical protein